jgi:hypothetical protein
MRQISVWHALFFLGVLTFVLFFPIGTSLTFSIPLVIGIGAVALVITSLGVTRKRTTVLPRKENEYVLVLENTDQTIPLVVKHTERKGFE